MEALANLNGEVMPLAEARISALDRGFLFGDAVYEVLRVYQGRPWLEEEHFQRLERSLAAIRIAAIFIRTIFTHAIVIHAIVNRVVSTHAVSHGS